MEDKAFKKPGQAAIDWIDLQRCLRKQREVRRQENQERIFAASKLNLEFDRIAVCKGWLQKGSLEKTDKRQKKAQKSGKNNQQ